MMTFSLNQGISNYKLKRIAELIAQMQDGATEQDLEFATDLYLNIVEGKTTKVNLKSFATVSRNYERQHRDTELRYTSLDSLQEQGFEKYFEDSSHPNPEDYRVSTEEMQEIVNALLRFRHDVIHKEGYDLMELILKAQKEINEIASLANEKIMNNGKRLTKAEKQRVYDSTFYSYVYGWADKVEMVDDGHGGTVQTRYNVLKKLEAAKRIKNAERREAEIEKVMKLFPKEEKSIAIIRRIVDGYTETYNGFTTQELLSNVISNVRIRDYVEEIIRFES